MNPKQIENLQFHIIQIATSFINEISEDNTILVLDINGAVVPEPVCNHHLIDLLSQLNSNVFNFYCESLFMWLADQKNGYSGHPFTLDSYTLFCQNSPENEKIFKEAIADKQLADGSIPVYTAFVEGGDFFSTLWATKILVNYDKETFNKTITNSIDYLINKQSIAARSLAQRGFLLYLLLKFYPAKYQHIIALLLPDILDHAKKISFTGSVLSHINDLYLLEDLVEYYKCFKDESVLDIIGDKLVLLFQLNENEPIFPVVFQNLSDIKPQQPYLQLLLKSAVVATKYLNSSGAHAPIFELNSHLHRTYRQIMYLGLKADRELKKYKIQYDTVAAEFQHYEADLKIMWDQSKSEYDKSVFLMMPFKTDMEYRVLTDEIKKVCEEMGFKAFRVDDPFRKPYDTLWDNIVLNMLGCKYGISVYVSEKSIDKASEEIRFFHNPNVALEFGFMKSRGKKILILKDKASNTPSDLHGFLWRPFDIKNPDKTVSDVLKPWLTELLGKSN